jgi:hypothetical protein
MVENILVRDDYASADSSVTKLCEFHSLVRYRWCALSSVRDDYASADSSVTKLCEFHSLVRYRWCALSLDSARPCEHMVESI